MKYNVAVIGYGYWGPKLSRNFSNSNNFEIKHVIDISAINLNKAKKNFPLCKISKNYKSIFNQKVDLVVISTTTISHYKICKFFLKFTNVLVEKPLSLTSKQVLELEELAKKNKKLLFVDYPFIFSGSVNYLSKIIKNNSFGKLNEIESFREQAPIRKDINVIWDLGVHDISILNFLLGSNSNVVNIIKYKTKKLKKIDTAYINLIYKNNIKVLIKNSWISPIKIRLIKFKFDNAIIYYDENDPLYKIKIYTLSKANKSLFNIKIPEIDITEPLFRLVEYIEKSLNKKTNKIFENNFKLNITKTLEKISKW